MSLQKSTYTNLTIKPLAHDQLHFVEAKNRKIGKKILHIPDFMNVAGQFPVIERKLAGFFTERDYQVELTKSGFILVPAILNWRSVWE